MWLPATTHPGPPPNHCLHPAALQAKTKEAAKNTVESESESESDPEEVWEGGTLRAAHTLHPLPSLGRGEPAWGCLPPPKHSYPQHAGPAGQARPTRGAEFDRGVGVGVGA